MLDIIVYFLVKYNVYRWRIDTNNRWCSRTFSDMHRRALRYSERGFSKRDPAVVRSRRVVSVAPGARGWTRGAGVANRSGAPARACCCSLSSADPLIPLWSQQSLLIPEISHQTRSVYAGRAVGYPGKKFGYPWTKETYIN